jgi:hypothetical protein
MNKNSLFAFEGSFFSMPGCVGLTLEEKNLFLKGLEQ